MHVIGKYVEVRYVYEDESIDAKVFNLIFLVVIIANKIVVISGDFFLIKKFNIRKRCGLVKRNYTSRVNYIYVFFLNEVK